MSPADSAKNRLISAWTPPENRIRARDFRRGMHPCTPHLRALDNFLQYKTTRASPVVPSSLEFFNCYGSVKSETAQCHIDIVSSTVIHPLKYEVHADDTWSRKAAAFLQVISKAAPGDL